MKIAQLKKEIRSYVNSLRIQQRIKVTVDEGGKSITVTFSQGQSYTADLTEIEQQDPIAQCRDIDYFHYYLTKRYSRWEEKY